MNFDLIHDNVHNSAKARKAYLFWINTIYLCIYFITDKIV